MKTRVLSLLAVGACLWAPLPSLAAGGLPDRLELNYSLHYGGLTVGTSTRTLERLADGTYRHALHTTPAGMARLFTQVEWFEEGIFRIVKNQVRPLSYLAYRVGADKPHRHSATFDWDKAQIRYSSGVTLTLPDQCQDQGSILFALMLNPPRDTQTHTLSLSSGKKLTAYDYRYLYRDDIDTPLGRLKTLVIQWSPHAPTDEAETYTAWLAVDKGHIPVRLVTLQKNKTATMTLLSLKGI